MVIVSPKKLSDNRAALKELRAGPRECSEVVLLSSGVTPIGHNIYSIKHQISSKALGVTENNRCVMLQEDSPGSRV
jgi:hypothetical protein